MKDKPNKVTTVLKVIVAGEFYDDDSTEETLRYAVEQDLEDAGFDVDVAILKEQEAIKPITEHKLFLCPICKNTLFREQKFCHECGKRIEWKSR